MKEEVIDMSRYVEAEPVVERCAGCKHVFDFTPTEGMIVDQRCRVYLRPEVKWPREGDKFVMMRAKVRDIDDKGKPFTEEREVPIFPKSCPMATHYTPPVVLRQTEKVLVGQQKQKKKH
jgi:molybdopterin converting factor small subunit